MSLSIRSRRVCMPKRSLYGQWSQKRKDAYRKGSCFPSTVAMLSIKHMNLLPHEIDSAFKEFQERSEKARAFIKRFAYAFKTPNRTRKFK